MSVVGKRKKKEGFGEKMKLRWPRWRDEECGRSYGKEMEGALSDTPRKIKGSRRSCRGVDRASMMKLSKLSPDPDWAPGTKIHTKVLLLHHESSAHSLDSTLFPGASSHFIRQ